MESDPASAQRDGRAAAGQFCREQSLARLRTERFDVAVIGGGINGAAIARDAALRGLKVALVDKGDFAGATSSRSSKLIHGGVRYLPQGQIHLVYTALRERERLRRRTAPHLVRPIRFLMPLYRGRGYGRFMLGAGLLLYDLFALTPRPEWHRTLDAAGALALEPTINREGLRGAALYYDAWADDARLTLENVMDAAYHGAAAANYVALEGFSREAGRLSAATLRDRLGGESLTLSAARFVNAAGPWVDDVRRLDDPAAPLSVRLTKGVHIVIARDRLPVREPLVLSDSNRRIIFVMPHERYVLVGTTDTDFDGDRDRPSAAPEDIAYLLGLLRQSLPAVELDQSAVAYGFAGLRALLIGEGRASPSAVSREETVIESRSGLLSVAGGKLTTHREIAQNIVDRLAAELGCRAMRCPTLDTPLPGARPAAAADSLADLAPALRELLMARYGSRAHMVAKLVRERPELGEYLAPGCPAAAAEVVHAVREEMARSLSDFLVRRTALVWRSPREAEAAAPAAARLMARELGWDSARERAELGEFAMGLWSRRAA